MKARWAARSKEERAALGARISEGLTGKKQSEEHRRKNSECRKGVNQTQATIDKRREGLRRAHAEGKFEKRKPNPPCSQAKREALSRGMKKAWTEGRHHTSPTKGLKMGPRSEETKAKISVSTKGRPSTIPPEKRDAWREAVSRGKKGHKQSPESNAKRGESLRRAYAEGRHKVSEKSGYGKGTHYESPHQGRIWLRSSAEVQRAQELDAADVSWLYEAQRFPVVMQGRCSTYTPDFWVYPADKSAPIDLENPTIPGVRIEDIKGWWKPTHKTYEKITAFQEQYPELNFQIVIREGFHAHA